MPRFKINGAKRYVHTRHRISSQEGRNLTNLKVRDKRDQFAA